jgi:F0F1-type ATP synthase delta subunit
VTFLPVTSKENKMTDNVNHPKHYTQGKIEVIDFILDQKMPYLESNVIKYICRHRYKNGLEDLKKAQWYINKLIEVTENELSDN